MIKRNFDWMISYFNRTVADMDIDQKYKMTLLGIITAIGHEHELTKPKWIPVTERLPDTSDTVLITHKGGCSIGWYNGRFWERGASTNHRKLQTVIAWMPLPEPYNGDKE